MSPYISDHITTPPPSLRKRAFWKQLYLALIYIGSCKVEPSSYSSFESPINTLLASQELMEKKGMEKEPQKS